MGQRNLALLYQNGWGVHLDYVEAYKWYALSSKRGYDSSRQAMKKLMQVMTAAQVAEGEKRAALWLSQGRAAPAPDLLTESVVPLSQSGTEN
jgi:TPR repeat protein